MTKAFIFDLDISFVFHSSQQERVKKIVQFDRTFLKRADLKILLLILYSDFIFEIFQRKTVNILTLFPPPPWALKRLCLGWFAY